ncbi:hypothetical protein BO71DRAFT_2408 [Aspergillus ellipticus CBS 707.79]|uniref:Uncharacterized protein n=1 Tax=Aspergillus ellipticus CBS 707.79 TaxID=1448320 RepID=A0A319DMW2_9EURO|nr:hypothetical protein BO71DRAFT_2408 [Aspergillus ellipticus CBS 707.79]
MMICLLFFFFFIFIFIFIFTLILILILISFHVHSVLLRSSHCMDRFICTFPFCLSVICYLLLCSQNFRFIDYRLLG